MTIKDLHQYSLSNLTGQYPEKEAKNLTYMALSNIFNFSRYQIHLNFDKTVDVDQYAKIKNIVDELKQYKPIQYIFKETEFYNCRLNVSEDVLIPRPETEELVNWIIQDQKNEKIEILDIGTGSGCIAIALAKNLSSSKVTAIDISPNAIEIAKSNAIANNVEIKFREVDLFNIQKELLVSKFDIIVSNPPYVRECEKMMMQSNVLNWEPEISLFVPDDNPLLFYNTIIPFAATSLKNKGLIYLEINENYPEEVKEVLLNHDFSSIEIRIDFSGKFRMIKASKT